MVLGIDAYDVGLEGWRARDRGRQAVGKGWRQEPPFSRPARLFASKLEIYIYSIPSTKALFWAVF
jgi:hypothetical protein